MIAGVAAGLAEYFHLDPTLMRLLWVLLFFAGPGLPVYLLAAVIIPVEPAPEGEEPAGAAGEAGPAGPDGARVFGWILIVLGAMFFLQRYTWIRWDHLWPVALILLGVYLLVGGARDPR